MHCVYTGGIQTSPKHTAGCSNIWGCLNMRGIQTYRGHPNIWGIWTLPKCDKACFLCVVYVWGASKHYLNIQGCPNIEGVHQNIWGMQTYMGCPNKRDIQTYGWCPNIWGHPNIQGVSKHIGSIQTYRGCPHIWGHSNIQGTIQTFGGIQTYEASKCMGHMDTP